MTNALYIAFPAIFGAILLVPISFLYVAISPKTFQIRVSYLAAWGLLGLAACAHALTFLDPISFGACWLGRTGYTTALLIAAVDFVNLVSWQTRRMRSGQASQVAISVSFILLRLLQHAVLAFAFRWSAMLCTV